MKYMPLRIPEADHFHKEYSRELQHMSLTDLVKEFFTYLDCLDESDSGREFHPVTVSSCRVQLTEPVGMVLERMRELITKEVPSEASSN